MNKKVRDKLLNIPSNIAKKIAATREPFEVETLLNSVFIKALTELSEGE